MGSAFLQKASCESGRRFDWRMDCPPWGESLQSSFACVTSLVVAAILVLCESNPVEHLCESRVLIRLADARPFEPPAVRLQWRRPHHLWGNYQKQRLCFVHLWFFYLLPLVCGTLSSTFECWTCANSLRALIPSIAITHLLSSQPGAPLSPRGFRMGQTSG